MEKKNKKNQRYIGPGISGEKKVKFVAYLSLVNMKTDVKMKALRNVLVGSREGSYVYSFLFN